MLVVGYFDVWILNLVCLSETAPNSNSNSNTQPSNPNNKSNNKPNKPNTQKMADTQYANVNNEWIQYRVKLWDEFKASQSMCTRVAWFPSETYICLH